MWGAGTVVCSELDPRFSRDSWALCDMAVQLETVGHDMTVVSGFSALGIQ